MIRSELIQKLHAKNSNLDFPVVEEGTKIIFDKIINTLVDGDRVEIRGFGSFSLRTLNPHIARNPKTGERVDVGHRFSLYFRPGKLLKEMVDKSVNKNV